MARGAHPDGNWQRHPVAVTGRSAPEPGVRRYRATTWASRGLLLHASSPETTGVSNNSVTTTLPGQHGSFTYTAGSC
jgi:hypothetical protein